MNLACVLHIPSPQFQPKPQNSRRKSKSQSAQKLKIWSAQKRCLRCNTFYEETNNSPFACSFHGHATEGGILINKGLLVQTFLLNTTNKGPILDLMTTLWDKGLFAFAPPHQGIDGEWSDRSGVIVYKWNDKDNRPNTGVSNWKKRWSCCAEYDENAPPCQRGRHVSYDDGFTLY